ncbi:MAG: segregation/condensation protein A [Bifidobacteriaceae bacterium]|jgi:segregation and condensation protein A|nr:segregation/condensation protein A [Bifidobacteriaceae bacterium]
MSREFEISQPAFSGPYEVLLDLIHKNKLDISTLSLYLIVDEFLEYVKEIEEKNLLQEMSSFAETAALLLKIKLSVLLPKPESLMTEEDFETLEARDILFAKLLQYSAFKTVASILEKEFNSALKTYPRMSTLENELNILPPLKWNVTREKLAIAYANALLSSAPEEIDLSHLHNPKLSVSVQREKIIKTLQKVPETKFSSLIKNEKNNLAICVIFVALLIMYKDKEIDLEQKNHLQDIDIRKLKGETKAEAKE